VNVFPIAPAASRYMGFLIPVTVLLLGILVGSVAVLVTSVRGAHTSRFEVRADGLRLVGTYTAVCSQSAAPNRWSSPHRSRREDGLQPKSRRMGTALPGYQAGWFRLRNGEKALLYLTDRTRAIYIPTQLGTVCS